MNKRLTTQLTFLTGFLLLTLTSAQPGSSNPIKDVVMPSQRDACYRTCMAKFGTNNGIGNMEKLVKCENDCDNKFRQ